MGREVNTFYLTSWVLAITLLFFQYGFCVTYFNSFTEMIYPQFERKGINVVEGENTFNSIVSAMIPLGGLIGALTGGGLPSIGRKRAIMVLDLFIIIGAFLTILPNFFILLAGRLIIGVVIGASTVVCPLFVNEICPVEYTGTMGAFLQIQIAIGLIFAYSLGFLVPYKYNKHDGKINEEIYTSTIWKFIFLFPAFIAAIQLSLLACIFKYDSPKFYNLNRMPNLEIEALRLITSENMNHNLNETDPSVSGYDTVITTSRKVTFCELLTIRFRYALFVGCALVLFNQLTGAIAIAFYSNKIFIRGKEGYEAEHFARVATLMLGFSTFGASCLAAYFLSKYGRKTLFLIGFIGMAIIHLILSVCAYCDYDFGIYTGTAIFSFIFNISIGTVLAPYNAEILPDKGLSIAQFFNWTLVIAISLVTEQGFELLKAHGMYGIFCISNAIGIIFGYFIVRETKGKSKEELAFLYCSNLQSLPEKNQDYQSMITIQDENPFDEKSK